MHLERLSPTSSLSFGQAHTLNRALQEIERLVNGLTASGAVQMNQYALTMAEPIEFFPARIVDAGTPIAYTLSAALTPEATSLTVAGGPVTTSGTATTATVSEDEPTETAKQGETELSRAVRLKVPFPVLVGSERLTVTAVSGSAWTVSRPSATDSTPTYAAGDQVLVIGSRPYAFVEQAEYAPGILRDKTGAVRKGHVQRDNTGKVVGLLTPAFEIHNRAVPIGSVVMLRRANDSDHYLFETALGGPILARLTGVANPDTALSPTASASAVEFTTFPGYTSFSPATPPWTSLQLAGSDRRLRYAFREVYQSTPGQYTDRPGGMDDQQFSLPAYEVNNAWLPTDGSIVVALWPYRTSKGLHYVFFRPAGVTLVRTESGNALTYPSKGNDTVLVDDDVIAAQNSSGTRSATAPTAGEKVSVNAKIIRIDTTSGFTTQTDTAVGTVLLTIADSNSSAGGVTSDVSKYPTQIFSGGVKCADGWGSNGGGGSSVLTTDTQGVTAYGLDSNQENTGEQKELQMGDLESSGDVSATGTVSGTELEGNFDAGTF